MSISLSLVVVSFMYSEYRVLRAPPKAEIDSEKKEGGFSQTFLDQILITNKIYKV